MSMSSEGVSDAQHRSVLVFEKDHYIEGVWLAQYVQTNATNDDEDRTDDGTHRLVRTVPHGWEVRTEMLAVLFRNGNEWRSTIRWRYWGGVDGEGVNDTKSVMTAGLGTLTPENVAALVSEHTAAFSKVEAHLPQDVILSPVEYISVRGDYERYAAELKKAGVRTTVVSETTAA